jgi:hypothetical protein
MQGDLVVLVPDRNTEATVEGLLKRTESLQIRPLTCRILVHPEKDPGCRLHGHELLRINLHQYRFALMIFDLEGSGAENSSKDELEKECEEKLVNSGWGQRGAVIVVEPELDVWVWSDSPVVDEVLGWSGRDPN